MPKKLITRQDLQKLSHHNQIRFACFSAEQVVHLVEEEHKVVCVKAIKTTYLFIEGKASKEDCRAAANAAANAATAANATAANAAAYAATAANAANAAYADADAANAAADAAAYAAYAAAYAATAAKQSIISAQWEYYDQLLNIDSIFEEIVLNTKY